MSCIPTTSSTSARAGSRRLSRARFRLAAKWVAFAYHRDSVNSTTSTPDTSVAWLRRSSSGAQLVVPGIRPSGCRLARLEIRVRSRIAKPTATPIPCTTPTNATVSKVMMASANSILLKRADRLQVADVEKMGRDVHEHAGERGQRQVLEQPGGGYQRDDPSRRKQSRKLRAAPGGDDRAGPRRARVDRKGACESGQDAPSADTEQVLPGVDRTSAVLGKGTARRGSLRHDDERHHAGDRSYLAELGEREPRQTEVGRSVGKGAQHGDSVGVQVCRGDQHRRRNQSDKRARNPTVDPLRAERDGEHAHADADRPPTRVTEMLDGGGDPVQGAAAGAVDAEQIRQLMDHDQHCDPGQEAGDDRCRQELGEPPQPKQPDQRDDHTHRDGEDRDELVVAR